MNQPSKPNMDIATQAALYAAGALTDEERQDFEARLLAGEKVCVAEFERFEAVVSHLAASETQAVPSDSVKKSLMARIEADRGAGSEADEPPKDHVFMLRAAEGQWQETGVQGVRLKLLYVDQQNNRQTFLVRMEPGTTFPSHPHAGAEECYVIEGDLYSEGQWMQPGDYQRAQADSQHGETRTRKGCLCLVTAAVA